MVGARGWVAARAVETAEMAGARGCVVARAMETAEMAGARGCWAAGATKVARLAKASCWAAGATKVARLAVAGGCWAAGTGGGCRECAHGPDMYVAWLRSATAMAAAVERFWASREARRASCFRRVRAASWIPARVVSEERSRAAAFVRSGRISRSCSAAAKSSTCWSAVVRACSMPSSTSRRETNLIWAWMSGSRLSQTEARYRRWGGGPRGPTLKALGGRGELGRNPRVRPVPEPEMSRKAVDSTGEVLRGGCVAEGDGGATMVLSVDAEAGLLTFLTVVVEVDGGAAMVLSEGAEAVLLAVLAAEVVKEDMLREARKGTRGEKSRGGHMEPAGKGGCLAASVLVTRGVVAGIRYSCNLPETGACRWGVKRRFERYSSGI